MAGREPSSGDGARFSGLNAFRAVIVVCVVAFHVLFSARPAPWLSSIIGHLAFTVTGFFVLSGFLLTRPFAVALRRGTRVDIPAYLRNRALRIVPLYVVVCAAALAAFPARRQVSLLLATATFTGTYVNHNPFDVLAPVTWALDNDIWFYLSLPVLYLVIRRAAPPERRLWWMAAAVMVLAVASYVLHLGVLTVGGVTMAVAYSSNLYRMYPTQFFVFAFGMMLAIGHTRWPGWQPARPGMMALVLACGMLLLALGYASVTTLAGAVQPLYTGGFAVLIGAVIFAAPSSRYRAILAVAPLAYLGEVSYGLYLWHPVVLHVLRDEVRVLPASFWPAFALVYGASLLTAAATYQLVEQPALRRKTRWVAGPAASPAHRQPGVAPDSLVTAEPGLVDPA